MPQTARPADQEERLTMTGEELTLFVQHRVNLEIQRRFDHADCIDTSITTAECEELVRQIVPGIGNVYVEFADAVPASLHWPCASWTAEYLDELMRPRLELTGRWRGRGLAMIVHRDWFLPAKAIVIHEAAHYVADNVVDKLNPHLIDSDHYAQAIAREWTAVPKPSADETRPLWDRTGYHGRDFIRAALHLLHRARRLGYDFTVDQCGIGGPRYGLSSGERYEEALRPELESFAHDRPLADLRDMATPIKFLEAWFADAKTI